MNNLSRETGIIYLLEDAPNQRESTSSLEVDTLLTPNIEKQPLKQKNGYYNVGWNNHLHRIISKKNITANDVSHFKELAKTSLQLDMNWMLCGHQPVYAIELFSDDVLYFKTSFCFDCDTWINEIQGEFVRLSLRNAGLLDWLNSIIPLRKEGA